MFQGKLNLSLYEGKWIKFMIVHHLQQLRIIIKFDKQIRIFVHWEKSENRVTSSVFLNREIRITLSSR